MVAIINSGHSKARRIMDLLRVLVLLSMKHNFYVRARDVPRIVNEIADALSPVSGYALPGSRPPGGEHPLYHLAISHDPLREEVLRYANW